MVRDAGSRTKQIFYCGQRRSLNMRMIQFSEDEPAITEEEYFEWLRLVGVIY